MKKIFLKIMPIGIICGFIISALRYQGYIDKITIGLKEINIFFYFIFFIFSFYLSLTIHEFGHFFGFKIKGIKNRAIYLTAFGFVKNEKGWVFKFKPKMFKLLGGFVIPDLNPIEDDKTYNEAIDNFSFALIMGPIFTLVSCILMCIIFLLVWIYSNNLVFISVFLINTVFVSFFSVIYLLASKVNTNEIFGDFVANKNMKQNIYFQYIQIRQYIEFSLKDHLETKSFLIKKAEEILSKNNYRNQMFYKLLLKQYIVDKIDNGSYEFPEKITNLIKKINLSFLNRNLNDIELSHAIIYVYYINDMLDDCFMNYIKIKASTLEKHKEEIIYLNAYSDYLLNLNDDLDYLEKNHVKNSIEWVFEDVLNNEEHKIKRLPNKLWQTEIYCSLKDRKVLVNENN